MVHSWFCIVWASYYNYNIILWPSLYITEPQLFSGSHCKETFTTFSSSSLPKLAQNDTLQSFSLFLVFGSRSLVPFWHRAQKFGFRLQWITLDHRCSVNKLRVQCGLICQIDDLNNGDQYTAPPSAVNRGYHHKHLADVCNRCVCSCVPSCTSVWWVIWYLENR